MERKIYRNSPTHSRDKAYEKEITVNGQTGIQVVNPAAEMRAWTLAEYMIGDKLNKGLRDCTTATYVTNTPIQVRM